MWVFLPSNLKDPSKFSPLKGHMALKTFPDTILFLYFFSFLQKKIQISRHFKPVKEG
jgi:hypothetical protein